MAIGAFIGLAVLIQLAGPRANDNPVALLSMIESAAPQPPDFSMMDTIDLVGKPVVDMVHTESDRSVYIQVFVSDYHFFEIAWDESRKPIFIHYFTGGARLSRDQIFVYD